MSISASFEIGSQFLAGNPIYLTVYVSGGASVRYQVSEHGGSAVLFDGIVSSVSSMQRVNINGLFVNNRLEDGVKEYDVKLLHDSEVLQSAVIAIFPGGISKRLHRELAKQGLTIFNTKLNPSDQNFLLSTRSFSKTLVIPEDEVLPIPYYTQNKVFSCMGESVSYGSSYDVGYLDIETIRENYFGSSMQVASEFPIVSGGGTSVDIILSSVEQPHEYYIKFRNSLGAMEQIAMENDVAFAPEFSTEYVSVYDRVSGDTMKLAHSVLLQQKYSGKLRAVGAQETMFVVDMLVSTEQYLVTPSGEFRVRVSAGEQVFQDSGGTPRKISVSIESIDEERYYAPIDMERLGLLYDNIFTQEFTTQYT